MKKLTLPFALFAIFGLAAVASVQLIAPSVARDGVLTVAANEQTAIFVVERMTCAACPITVRAAMQGVDGVNSVSVDFGAKTATVVFDPAKTTIEAIAAASANVGYPAVSQVKEQGG